MIYKLFCVFNNVVDDIKFLFHMKLHDEDDLMSQ
jgi:hypothetical protein